MIKQEEKLMFLSSGFHISKIYYLGGARTDELLNFGKRRGVRRAKMKPDNCRFLSITYVFPH